MLRVSGSFCGQPVSMCTKEVRCSGSSDRFDPLLCLLLSDCDRMRLARGDHI